MTSWLIWMNWSPGMKITCGKRSRRCELIVALSVLALSCAAAQAQPQSHRPAGRPMGGPPRGGGLPPNQSIRDRWLAMPPEALQHVRRNAERWRHMNADDGNVVRQRDKLRAQTV